MRVLAATDPGSTKANEDNVQIGSHTAIVIDGATARTDTGCIHGVSWYAAQLGSAIQHRQYVTEYLSDALAMAISDVAQAHGQTCDLAHSGTPSAAIVIVRKVDTTVQWLVLGDVTLLLDECDGLKIITDPHTHVAAEEQAEADKYLIGDPRKTEAMQHMKKAELAARNTPGGFWVAAADPAVVDHALTGTADLAQLQRAVLLTDGAARLVDTFNLHTWEGLLEKIGASEPGKMVQAVREAEASDPLGRRWPRNKKSDDATVAVCDFSVSN